MFSTFLVSDSDLTVGLRKDGTAKLRCHWHGNVVDSNMAVLRYHIFVNCVMLAGDCTNDRTVFCDTTEILIYAIKAHYLHFL